MRRAEFTETAKPIAQDSIDYRGLFYAVPGQYLILNPNLEILDASNSYLEATGKKRGDIVGRQLLDIFPTDPDDSGSDFVENLTDSLERLKKTLSADTMAVQRHDVTDPDDPEAEPSERWWSPVNTPILDKYGDLKMIVHQVVDVTEFVQTTEARAVASHESKLRAEILKRSAALGESNDMLRAASAAKNQFLARVSHELRTPLTAINGFGELLSLSSLNDDQRRWVNTIRRSGSHLLDLIDEVLDISRIESGEFSVSVEPVSIERVLNEAIEIMSPLASANEITIERAATVKDVYVRADNQRLRQILINLISNAIKYNHPGGRVFINVSAADGKAYVSVADTGFGIAERDLQRLFKPFERLGPTNTGTEGTGLGLALSRNLVEILGGTIDVSSTVGEGTKFTVGLEITEPRVVDSGSASSSPVLETREYDREVKLLYVEDTAVNVRLVEEILKRRPSVRFIPAMFGRLAIELANKNKPDIVLLDLHLPDIGGEEVLSYFAVRPELSKIPVIVLSADATMSQLDDLIYLGAKDYLVKPIGVEQLLETVDRYVEGEPDDTE